MRAENNETVLHRVPIVDFVDPRVEIDSLIRIQLTKLLHEFWRVGCRDRKTKSSTKGYKMRFEKRKREDKLRSVAFLMVPLRSVDIDHTDTDEGIQR